MAKKTKEPSKGVLDKLWQQAVVSGKKCCESCGLAKPLSAHHIYTRRRFSTRWLYENGIALCTGCHVYSSLFSAHLTPRKFYKWLEEKKGKEWLDKLERKSNEIAKGQDKFKIKEDLLKLIK